MGKKKKKTRRDTAEIARSVVEQAIGEPLTPREDDDGEAENNEPIKPGPSQGGKARANKLTPEERSRIAKKAALSRWNKGRLVDDDS